MKVHICVRLSDTEIGFMTEENPPVRHTLMTQQKYIVSREYFVECQPVRPIFNTIT